MLKPEQIPRAVVEAMARSRALRNEGDDRYWPDYADGVEADLRAGLKAWPGFGIDACDNIILPLPQEAGDE